MREILAGVDGLTRITADDERRVSLSIALVVTDQRILFVSGDSAAERMQADAGSLAYGDIAAVSVEGSNTPALALSMTGGVRWEFPLPEAEGDAVERVVAHLRWVGTVRARLVACRNDVELAAGGIRSHAEAMDWIDGEETYEETRSQLDSLITAVQLTDPIEDEVLAPELTDMERTLEHAYTRLFIERAHSQLQLGQQLVESGDYEQAQPVLRTAYGQYERARGRADAVERADAFQFGEHRELLDELDRLAWKIETVAAEPIRQAHEAKIAATNATDPAVALDHWESAYQHYGDVLTLELGTHDRYFTGNREKVRQELHRAAEQLIDRHRTLADELADQSHDASEADDTKAALRTTVTARDHIARAAELASEYQPSLERELELRRQELEERVHELRESGDARMEPPDAETSETEDESADEQGTVGSLSRVDTHHDIALDGQTLIGGRSGHPGDTDASGQSGSNSPKRIASPRGDGE